MLTSNNNKYFFNFSVVCNEAIYGPVQILGMTKLHGIKTTSPSKLQNLMAARKDFTVMTLNDKWNNI